MASTYINIKTIGDGSISFVSSSGVGTCSVSIGTNGSGVYEATSPPSDYKFLINKKCISISTIYTGAGGVISSSSLSMRDNNGVLITILANQMTSSYISTTMYKDRSFTIIDPNPADNTTYDISILFYPKLDFYKLMLEKPSSYGKVDFTVPFINSNTENSAIEVVASGKELPTTIDYENGYMYRYFYRLASSPLSIIRELLKKQYDNISKNSTYKSIRIKWKITGEKSEVENTNTNIIENADIEMPGIKNLLKRNILLYWKETAPPVGVEKINNRGLLNNG